MLPEKLKPGIYRMARVLRPVLPYGILANLGQWFTRYAHEPDFEVFDGLSDTRALVLDVGASRGQSALSILRRTRRMRVVSVEPNPKHRWSLMLIGLLHPFRFRFRMLAAGDVAGHETLHVPGRRASGLSAQGSLDPAEFEKEYVRDRLAEDGFDASDKSGYRLVPVEVMPLDLLGLEPDLIKIDVEGFEYQALKGLQRTLSNRYPALLIEVNNKQRWLPFLTKLGYGFYHFNSVEKIFEVALTPGEKLNLFCLHTGSDSVISQILLRNLKN
jgi:FkbM family methyltransferase